MYRVYGNSTIIHQVHQVLLNRCLFSNLEILHAQCIITSNHRNYHHLCTKAAIHKRLAPNLVLPNEYKPTVCDPQKSACVTLCQSVRHASDESFYYYFLSDFPPVAYAQKAFESIHDVSGLPWWASIAITTVALRTAVTLPLTIYCSRIMANIEKLGPEIQALSKACSREVSIAVTLFKWDEKRAKWEYNKTMKRLVRDLYIRENCHPYKTFVVFWAQIPLWMCFSFALRNMSGIYAAKDMALPHPEMAVEGALWFTDMTIPDPTYALPVVMGAINLLNIEVASLQGMKGGMEKYHGIINGFFRGGVILMVFVCSWLPSSVAFYWCCSSLTGLTQTLVLKSPQVRRALGMPKLANESSTPYQDLRDAVKAKYSFKKDT